MTGVRGRRTLPAPGSILKRIVAMILSLAAVVAGFLAVDLAMTVLVGGPAVTDAGLADVATCLIVLLPRIGCPDWFRFAPPPVRSSRGRASAILVCFTLAFLAGQTAALSAYHVLGSPAFDQSRRLDDQVTQGTLIVFTLLIAPVCEEVLFRGALYPLLRRWAGPPPVMVATSIPFAALHGNVVQAIAVVPMAMLLACVYEYVRRIALTIALHTVFNLFGMVIPAGLMMPLACPPVACAALAGFAVSLWFLHEREEQARTRHQVEDDARKERR